LVTVVMPDPSVALERYIDHLMSGVAHHRVYVPEDVTIDQVVNMHKVVFAIQLDAMGQNLTLWTILKAIQDKGSQPFEGITGMFIVKSPNEWYTKTFTTGLAFYLNQLGCQLMGHPLIEMTQNLNNLNRWEKTTGIDRHKLIVRFGEEKLERFIAHEPLKVTNPHVAVLHASSRETSNTLSLWHMVEKNLRGMDITELHVENGTVLDCIGCPYQTCLYFGRQHSCFYGGVMVKEVIPLIEKSDAIVWVCPNYNDSISANLMAVINRTTALYRTMSFYDRQIFAVIVSGNSGSDAVARQLISALNLNKGFQLPPRFCITETAYDPGSIEMIDNIEQKAQNFANHMMKQF